MIASGRQQVLFVDPSHGARSQMAAALLRSAARDRFEVTIPPVALPAPAPRHADEATSGQPTGRAAHRR